MLSAGARLKEIRNKLGISTRDVETLSRKIADAEGNEEFFCSNPWISRIETEGKVPNIFALFSLSAIYRIKFTDLLSLYGVNLERIAKHQLDERLDNTSMADLTVYDKDRSVSFPVRFDPGFNVDRTGVLARMVETWAEVPIALIQHLDCAHASYGYIGLKDYFMYPLIRPGSFVQLETGRTVLEARPWKSEYDRPIHFVQLANGYACAWCQIEGNEIILVPHPQSGCLVRRFAYPDQAEPIGRVTAVAMRIVNRVNASGDGPPQQLKPH